MKIRILSLLVVMLLVSVLPVHAQGGPSDRGARAEVRYLEGMIDHHQMALDMANNCLKKADQDSLKELCQNIITAQSAEITQMQGMLRDWYQIDYAPMPMGAGMQSDMMNMMSMMCQNMMGTGGMMGQGGMMGGNMQGTAMPGQNLPEGTPMLGMDNMTPMPNMGNMPQATAMPGMGDMTPQAGMGNMQGSPMPGMGDMTPQAGMNNMQGSPMPGMQGTAMPGMPQDMMGMMTMMCNMMMSGGMMGQGGMMGGNGMMNMTPMPQGGTMGQGDPRGMMGMMAGLNSLQGQAYDVAWLEAMIDHHDDAVHMSERLLPRVEHEELRTLAQKIIDDQTIEIQKMEQMLTLYQPSGG